VERPPCNRVTQATPLSGINFSFVVTGSTDLINNYTKLEASSFSHSKDTREPENVESKEM